MATRRTESQRFILGSGTSCSRTTRNARSPSTKRAFGYQVKTVVRDSGRDYNVLWSSGGPRGAVLQNPFDDVRSIWIPYVRVEDPDAVAERAVALGGKIVIPPRPEVRNGTLA